MSATDILSFFQFLLILYLVVQLRKAGLFFHNIAFSFYLPWFAYTVAILQLLWMMRLPPTYYALAFNFLVNVHLLAGVFIIEEFRLSSRRKIAALVVVAFLLVLLNPNKSDAVPITAALRASVLTFLAASALTIKTEKSFDRALLRSLGVISLGQLASLFTSWFLSQNNAVSHEFVNFLGVGFICAALLWAIHLFGAFQAESARNAAGHFSGPAVGIALASVQAASEPPSEGSRIAGVSASTDTPAPLRGA